MSYNLIFPNLVTNYPQMTVNSSISISSFFPYAINLELGAEVSVQDAFWVAKLKNLIVLNLWRTGGVS
jgi:hypothetical protein